MSAFRSSTAKDQSTVKLPDINPAGVSMNKGNSFKEDGTDGYSNLQPSMTQQVNGIDINSPFRLPSDEEVFLFRENERQRKQEIKSSNEGQRIWDKKTATNRTQLKHFKNFETKSEEKFVPKTEYNSKDKKLIHNALEIAKERQKNRENGIVKEPIVNLIEQKKEMFLVTMAHGIIQNEIEKLKQTTQEKQQALEMSSKMLEQDHKNFQDYLDKNKQQKVDAETKAEEEIQDKKKREQETKNYQIKLTSLRAERTRNEEAVINFKEHKDFLDKLAPKEWNDTKGRKRKERVSEVKEQWISLQQEKLSQEDQEGHDNNRQVRRDQQKQKKPALESRTEMEKNFQNKVEQGDFDAIDDFDDDFEMFFKTPQQLVEMFNDLEERNLLLIQTTQDSEQNLEELKTYFQKSKSEQDHKLKNLYQQKEMLKKNFDNVSQSIKTLQMKGSERENKRDYKDIRKSIIDCYVLFESEINLHDYNGKGTLDILVAVELYLEKQLKALTPFKPFKPDMVESQRVICERAQKAEQKGYHAEQVKKDLIEKTEKNMRKIMQPSKKKLGRQDMFRSAPFEKVEVSKVETFDNEEEEDKKYFLE